MNVLSRATNVAVAAGTLCLSAVASANMAHAGAVVARAPAVRTIAPVADSLDAMGSDRPYRKRLSAEKIDAILASGSGVQWDSAVVDAMFRVRPEIDAILHGDHDSVEAEGDSPQPTQLPALR